MSFSESSSETEEDPNKPPVILDSGDVRMVVHYSNQSLTLLGSSQALSLASPVWKKILNPPFPKLVSEGGGHDDIQDKQIDFSEDNGEALLLLLHIAHLQLSKVPSTQEGLDTILALTILCDKYDCAGLIKPWLLLWVGGDSTNFKYNDKPVNEEWLFIAWVFGRKNTFQSVATKLVSTVKINEEGENLNETGEVLPSQMPPGIIGRFRISFTPLTSTLSSLKSSANMLYLSGSLSRKHNQHPSRFHQISS